jgi:hypothetical protein
MARTWESTVRGAASSMIARLCRKPSPQSTAYTASPTTTADAIPDRPGKIVGPPPVPSSSSRVLNDRGS